MHALTQALVVLRGRVYAWRCVVGNVCLALAGLLEVFDFPPLWGILDAHALWHGLTIPIPFLLYRFLLDDSAHEWRAVKTLNEDQEQHHP